MTSLTPLVVTDAHEGPVCVDVYKLKMPTRRIKPDFDPTTPAARAAALACA